MTDQKKTFQFLFGEYRPLLPSQYGGNVDEYLAALTVVGDDADYLVLGSLYQINENTLQGKIHYLDDDVAEFWEEKSKEVFKDSSSTPDKPWTRRYLRIEETRLWTIPETNYLYGRTRDDYRWDDKYRIDNYLLSASEVSAVCDIIPEHDSVVYPYMHKIDDKLEGWLLVNDDEVVNAAIESVKGNTTGRSAGLTRNGLPYVAVGMVWDIPEGKKI